MDSMAWNASVVYEPTVNVTIGDIKQECADATGAVKYKVSTQECYLAAQKVISWVCMRDPTFTTTVQHAPI